MLGPNGAVKTTTLLALAGELAPLATRIDEIEEQYLSAGALARPPRAGRGAAGSPHDG